MVRRDRRAERARGRVLRPRARHAARRPVAGRRGARDSVPFDEPWDATRSCVSIEGDRIALASRDELPDRPSWRPAPGGPVARGRPSAGDPRGGRPGGVLRQLPPVRLRHHGRALPARRARHPSGLDPGGGLRRALRGRRRADDARARRADGRSRRRPCHQPRRRRIDVARVRRAAAEHAARGARDRAAGRPAGLDRARVRDRASCRSSGRVPAGWRPTRGFRRSASAPWPRSRSDRRS